MGNGKKIFAGIDVGSNTAEACVIDEDGNIRSSSIIGVRPNPERSARDVLDSALLSGGFRKSDIDVCFSTGYGRHKIIFAENNVSEISCHGRGAHFLMKSIRTIIDIGGQDCKIIKIDKDGFLEDFVMNDKCAAGAGRFLEMMSKNLNVDISELGKLSAASKRPSKFSSTCAIFAEIELLQKLYHGTKKKHLAAGIHESLARKIKSMAGRMALTDDICITGGVSKNNGMVKAIERELGIRCSKLPVDPQVIGALGAALFARDFRFMNERKAS